MNPSDNSRDNSSDLGSSLTYWLQGLLQAVAGFLRSGVFLRNLAVLAGFLILLFILVRWALSAYTHHGETLQVHNYIGMKLENAKQKARRRSFSIVVNDSLWIPNRSPGEVIEQTPKPLARVKQGRRIYLVVTRSQPPLRTLPSLVGNYDYEQYKRKLARKEIGARVREKQFNNKLEGNTILYLFHNGRKITDADLRQGVKVPAGDTLEFVITERMTNRVRIPEMTCRRFEEAQFYLESVDLTLGQVFGNVRNQSTAFVYDQEPQQGTMAPKGAAVNLYLRQSRPPGCPEDIDPSELSSRELEPDSLRQN